jgi:ligand-binding sensor domain-containing protein/signal transduction histidine kinase
MLHRWKLRGLALLLSSALLNLYSAPSPAPTRYSIKAWQSEDGLPQNSVFAITQTRNGYLWVGTGGKRLARFDGVHFKIFEIPELDSSTKVVKLFEDSQANLWIGTDKPGVLLVDRDGKFSQLGIGNSDTDGSLVSIAEDRQGSVWLSMAKGKLYRYTQGKPTLILNNHRGFACDNSGLIWIGTPDRTRLLALGPISGGSAAVAFDLAVGRLDFLLASKSGGYWRLAAGKIQKCKGDKVISDLGAYPWNPLADISAACEDGFGKLIVATYGDGIYWEDQDGKFSHVSSAEGLSHSYIYSVYLDRERNLWVGTDGGGLDRVTPQVFEVLNPSRALTVQSVSEDAKGGLWFSINNGGVAYWNDGKLKEFREREGLEDPYVRSIFVDASQQVWAGTENRGLFQLQKGRFEPVNDWPAPDLNVSSIYQSRDGTLWVGTHNGLTKWDGKSWTTLDRRTGLSANSITALAGDKAGALWAGTEDRGLNRLAAGHVTTFSRANGLPGNSISSLYIDSDDVVWVGTSSGLARYQDGKWTAYTTRQGLPDNAIGYLLEDQPGYLWIGSTAGITRVRKKDLNDIAGGRTSPVLLRVYGRSDGLPSSECTSGSQPAACRAHDGRLWFPTIRGLASIDPAKLNPNTNPPPVIIETVLIDGQSQGSSALRSPLPPQVRVQPGAESIEFKFTSLDLAAPESGHFRYRLEGYESAWTEKPADVRFAIYTKLPPGSYHFHVMAANQDGAWNLQGASVAVEVLPPFWRKPWFLTLTIVLLLATIVALVHFASTQRLHRQLEAMRQAEALEKERSRIARDLHDQLGANLTQVGLLAEMAESDKDIPQEVESHARQISHTARETTHALDEIVWTVNPSNDTLDGLVNYLCKYAQEYFALAELRYRLDVPPQLPPTPISPELRHNVFLAAKESVNNVVKHAKATSAWFRLKLENNRFVIEIEDNGQGLAPDAENKGRNGLRNMRKRMEDVGGSFEIAAGAEGGTRIRLIAPLGQ